MNIICQHTASLPPDLFEVVRAFATDSSSLDVAGVVANPVSW